MSKISFLEKLLDGVEVEWKALGKVSRFINGRAYKKPELLDQGKYPVLRVGNFFTNENWYYSDLELEEDKYCDNGDLLYAWSASFGPRIWEGGKVIYHYHIWKVVPDPDLILKKFLFYLLEWDTKAMKGEHATGSTMMHVTKGAIESRLVPIPSPENPKKSLEIQAEIVRILDVFTATTAELTAELSLRKKQYNHYRDQLLSFEEGEKDWKTLGWIGEVRMCKRILKSQTSDVGDVPFYKIGTFGKSPNSHISRDIYEKYRAKYNYPRVGEVLISASGTIGRAVIFDGEDAYFQDSNIVWLENNENKVLNKYLFYFYQIANWHVSDGGVIKRLYNDNIKKTPILIPYPNDPEKSLAEQARIVDILDTFDSLTNSVTEGLPHEIELRQKQYEYYRDLLLSFPKPDAEVAA